MKFLIHYTSLLVALNILKTKKIKFGNLRLSNDRLEFEAHDEDDISLYAFCTSKGNFDALMWNAYAKGDIGAAIIFNFKSDKTYNDLFLNKNIESNNIEYVPEYYEALNENEDIITKLGWIKSQKFEKEDEYRYLIKEFNYSTFSKIIELNIESLESINVVVSPFAKKIVETFVKGLYAENECEVKIIVTENNFNK